MNTERLRYAAVVLLCLTAGSTGSQLVKVGLWPYAVALGVAVMLVTALEIITQRAPRRRRKTSA